MASAATTARQRHLKTASELLLAKSPSVSAYLQSVKQAHKSEAPDSSETVACKSCGSLLLPGWNCKTRPTKQASQRTRKDRLAGLPNQKSITLECSLCHEVTVIKSQKPKKPSRSFDDQGRKRAEPENAMTTKSETLLPSGPPLPPAASPPAAVLETGVKKRSRGKKSSLQAMLAGRKVAGPSKGFGLGLEDFMKKPG